MQIQLKQKEIEAALKMYINRQGIALAGKTVTIDFTAGRKDSGLSADIVIEDSEVLDYEEVKTPPPAESPTEEVPVKAGNIFSK